MSLQVDGENDQCSRAEDINFELIGFSIYGQVCVFILYERTSASTTLVWPARPIPPLLFYYAEVYKPQHSKIHVGVQLMK